jgi:hypothetical protein
MFRRLLARQRQQAWDDDSERRGSLSLQIVLWLLWSLVVALVGYLNWYADFAAQRPINMLGLVIHCIIAGLLGLIVMTWLEMRIEPWRFVNKD